jgi:hypothetical protein
LREVTHELVVTVQLIAFDADDGAVVRDPDQQVAALGIQERGERLQYSVGDDLIVVAVLFEIPA